MSALHLWHGWAAEGGKMHYWMVKSAPAAMSLCGTHKVTNYKRLKQSRVANPKNGCLSCKISLERRFGKGGPR